MTNEEEHEKMRGYQVGRSCVARRILQASLFFLVFMAWNSIQIRAQLPSGESGSSAQSGDPGGADYKLRRGNNEFAVWGAGSFDAPTLIGNTAYRPTAMLGLRYGKVVGTTDWATFTYVADLIPLQVVFDQEDGQAARRNVYGVGANYGGLKMSFLRRYRVKPFAGISGGLIVYSRPVPLEGRKLNLTYSLDAGLDIFTGKRRALTVGYKFYHVSNAFTAKTNVGTNDNMISLGFSFFR
ncbi:hypothetical protein BH20ACI3_BH20ACI3_42360 [soil metagenome]